MRSSKEIFVRNAQALMREHKKRGRSQEDVAAAAGMSPSQFSQAPATHTIEECFLAIAAALKISPPRPDRELQEFGRRYARAKDDAERTALVAEYMARQVPKTG